MDRLNISIIPCNSVEAKNGQTSLIGIFDKIRCRSDERVAFSLYVPYSIFCDSPENEKNYYQLLLNIRYLEDKEGKEMHKTLSLKEFRLPLENAGVEYEKGEMQAYYADAKKCHSGTVTFNCNISFSGEGYYQFEIKGRKKKNCSNDSEEDMIFAIAPITLDYIE